MHCLPPLLLLTASCLVTLTSGFSMRSMMQNLVVEARDVFTPQAGNTSLENHAIFHYLNKQYQGNGQQQKLVKTFDWADCGTGAEVANISRIMLRPDPVVLPGALNVSFAVELKDDLVAPLKMSVKLEKDIIFGWVTIPCIDDLGSCTYDDVCGMIHADQCPPAFVAHDIPCKCPFPKGSYNFPPASYAVGQSVPHGKYRAKVEITQNSQLVACVSVNLEVE